MGRRKKRGGNEEKIEEEDGKEDKLRKRKDRKIFGDYDRGRRADGWTF